MSSSICSVMMFAGLAACGDNHLVATVDAHTVAVDASADGVSVDAPGPLVRVFGHVEAFGEVQAGMEVVTLEGSPQTTVTDAQGDFFFDVPEGSRLIVRVNSGGREMLSMIRGVIAADHVRPRVFYMLTNDEIAATASALGITFDATTAVVEVDFRNAEIGGYGATLATPESAPLTPTFGVALDANGVPQLGQLTLTGGDGSTLLLAGFPAGATTFTPIVPAGASLPCQPRDADPLPLAAGAVTWFDYECGNGTD